MNNISIPPDNSEFHQQIEKTIDTIAPLAKWNHIEVKFGTNFLSYIVDLIRSIFVTKSKIQSALLTFNHKVSEIKKQYPIDEKLPNLKKSLQANPAEIQATTSNLNDLIQLAEVLITHGAVTTGNDHIELQNKVRDLINAHVVFNALEKDLSRASATPSNVPTTTPLNITKGVFTLSFSESTDKAIIQLKEARSKLPAVIFHLQDHIKTLIKTDLQESLNPQQKTMLRQITTEQTSGTVVEPPTDNWELYRQVKILDSIFETGVELIKDKKDVALSSLMEEGNEIHRQIPTHTKLSSIPEKVKEFQINLQNISSKLEKSLRGMDQEMINEIQNVIGAALASNQLDIDASTRLALIGDDLSETDPKHKEIESYINEVRSHVPPEFMEGIDALKGKYEALHKSMDTPDLNVEFIMRIVQFKDFRLLLQSHQKFLKESLEHLRKELNPQVVGAFEQMIEKNKREQDDLVSSIILGEDVEKPAQMDMVVAQESIRVQQTLINELFRYMRMDPEPGTPLDNLLKQNEQNLIDFASWKNDLTEQHRLKNEIAERQEMATNMEITFKKSSEELVNILRDFFIKTNSLTFEQSLHFSRLFGELVESFDDFGVNHIRSSRTEFVNKSREILAEFKQIPNPDLEITTLVIEMESVVGTLEKV